MPTFPQIIQFVVVIVGGACVVAQAVSGIAISAGQHVERRKAPVHFWVIISIEAFAVVVGGLAIFAFAPPRQP